MYLPTETQPDCASAWREAVRLVDRQPGHAAHNVIIDVADPTARATIDDPQIAIVEAFLNRFDKSVQTVANTIFPVSLYRRHGSPQFFDVFRDRILSKVRRTERWSGYYFERMMQYPATSGVYINQLDEIVRRINNPNVKALNKFELSLFDPARDVDDSPYGGQCLSFISLKLQPGTPRLLTATAMYRNHFYIEKMLGNLIGLGRLMDFVAKECNLEVGSLTVISTHAEVDTPGRCRRTDLDAMLTSFDEATG